MNFIFYTEPAEPQSGNSSFRNRSRVTRSRSHPVICNTNAIINDHIYSVASKPAVHSSVSAPNQTEAPPTSRKRKLNRPALLPPSPDRKQANLSEQLNLQTPETESQDLPQSGAHDPQIQAHNPQTISHAAQTNKSDRSVTSYQSAKSRLGNKHSVTAAASSTTDCNNSQNRKQPGDATDSQPGTDTRSELVSLQTTDSSCVTAAATPRAGLRQSVRHAVQESLTRQQGRHTTGRRLTRSISQPLSQSTQIAGMYLTAAL